jgi:hypothetical protein
MSLDAPTKTERVIAMWKGWPMWARAGVPVVILLFVIGAALFTSSKISNAWNNYQVNKARANVNAAMVAVNDAKKVVANDRVAEAVVLEQVNAATKDAIAASNATDQAKAEANAAVANFIAAKKANVPTGTTEADLDAKLRALEQ